MRSPLAICCRISALGLRSPRSIWLRYGLETPAAEASWRSEILACSRCWRMYSPMEPTFTGFTALSEPHLACNCKRPASTPGSPGEGHPDPANWLAAAEHRHLGDPVQLVPVHPRVAVRAEQAQQGDRDGRDRPARAIGDLHRPGPGVGQGERLHALGPGLDQQPGNRFVERAF